MFSPVRPLSDNEIFDEFVGEYPLDNGFDSKALSINPEKTFHFEVFTDTGAHWEQSGSIKMNNGKFELFISSERLPFLPKILTPVRWGARKYLIADDIDYFCKSVNEGDEPRNNNYGYFYIKNGDWKISVEGRPTSLNGQLICP
jgi:hypothetical protein